MIWGSSIPTYCVKSSTFAANSAAAALASRDRAPSKQLIGTSSPVHTTNAASDSQCPATIGSPRRRPQDAIAYNDNGGELSCLRLRNSATVKKIAGSG